MRGLIEKIECCALLWETTFCPQCGKQLRPKSTLEELIQYCATSRRKARASIETFKKNGNTARQKGAEESLLRFTRFVDELRDIQQRVESDAR
jgi:hypothetical protein